jgi:hypothetical protein
MNISYGFDSSYIRIYVFVVVGRDGSDLEKVKYLYIGSDLTEEQGNGCHRDSWWSNQIESIPVRANVTAQSPLGAWCTLVNEAVGSTKLVLQIK